MSVFGERYVPVGSVEAPDGELIDAIDSFHARPVALLVRAAAAGASRDGLAAQTRVLMSLPPHPNVSTVRDAFFAGDRYVVVMDRAEGQTLAALLASQDQPGLPVSAALGYLEQLAAAVDHLHRQQPPVVHGDVRPGQVMISAAGAVLLMLAGTSSRAGMAGDVARDVAGDVAGFAATAGPPQRPTPHRTPRCGWGSTRTRPSTWAGSCAGPWTRMLYPALVRRASWSSACGRGSRLTCPPAR
jgi:serine/threonine protein kinase